MTEFTLDTSGKIHFGTPYAKTHGLMTFYRWPDLDTFTQGYIEAALTSEQETLAEEKRERSCVSQDTDYTEAKPWPMEQYAPGFSDLAPETLAAILRDCLAMRGAMSFGPDHRQNGATSWRARQACMYPTFPPLTAYLGDDGKVYLRPANG